MTGDDAILALVQAADAHAHGRAPDDARYLSSPELEERRLRELRKQDRARLRRLRTALDDAFEQWDGLELDDDDVHIALDDALTDAYVILDALTELLSEKELS